LIVPALAIVLAYGMARLPTMFGGALLTIYVVSSTHWLPDTLEETLPYREVVDFLQANITPDEPILIELGSYVRDYALFEYYYIAANLPPENVTFAYNWNESGGFRVFPTHYYGLYYGNQADSFGHNVDRVVQNRPRFTVVSWYENSFNRTVMEVIGDRYDEVRRTEYGPIHIYEYFEQFTPTNADLLFTFDDTFVLARTDFPTSVQACGRLDVTTWWTLRGEPTDNYSMGLYLQDAGGVTQAQADGSPAGIETLSWEADRVYPDQRSLTVPCAPGRYDIRVTLYEPFSVTNLPVTDADGQDIGSVATLGSIEVIP
ncbi:MAG: hypothetical protein H7175_00075, partial [Burkholderiales bacterium]|nr:hypothetical protein [Anaerolineae bacterium]